MKKQLLLLSVVLFVTGLTKAQPEKKDLMIGSNITANYYDNSTAKLKTLAYGGVNITPMIGYCVGKGYVFGGGISYANMFRTDFDVFGNKSTRISQHSVGVFIFSRDIKRIADKFYTRAGTNIGYTVDMNRSRDFVTDTKTDLELTHTFNILFRMGLIYFPKPNIGIEFSYGEIGYSLRMQHIVNGSPRSISNSFVLKYGIDGIQLGLIVLIKPKKKEEEKK